MGRSALTHSSKSQQLPWFLHVFLQNQYHVTLFRLWPNFRCQGKVQLWLSLEHSFCVLTLRKHFPEDFTQWRCLLLKYPTFSAPAYQQSLSKCPFKWAVQVPSMCPHLGTLGHVLRKTVYANKHHICSTIALISILIILENAVQKWEKFHDP